MFELLIDFQGILGAIAGVIATLVTTELLRRVGRISAFTRNYEITFLKNVIDSIGSVRCTTVSDTSEASLLSYKINVAIYNASDIYFGLCNIRLEFHFSDGNLIVHTPHDNDKTTYSSFPRYEEFSKIDFTPKQLQLANFIGTINRNEFNMLSKSCYVDKVYLIGINHKNKKFRKKII